MEMLKGNDVYAAITIGDQEIAYKGSRTGSYYIITIDGRNGTCSPEFREAFKAGTVEQVSYTKTEYQPKDAEGKPRIGSDGQEMGIRPSITFGGYLTKDQVAAGLRGDKELVKARAELKAFEKVSSKVAERAAYIEMGIDQAEMKELMQLV
jgi:hypothetical protein